jgi:hypothetical protein
MNINLTIDQLILDGIDLPNHQRPDLQAAVEAELSRLLAEQGVGPHLQARGAVPSLDAEVIQLTSNDPATLGQQIAQAVYGGLSNEHKK